MKKIILPLVFLMLPQLGHADDRELVVVIPYPNISQDNLVDLETYANNDGATNVFKVGINGIQADLTERSIDQLQQTNQYKIFKKTASRPLN